MTDADKSLEHRVRVLEARVQLLEKIAGRLPEMSKAVKAYANKVTESHLNFRGEWLTLIEDHLEILKLMHAMTGSDDGGKNKMVLTYIRRAESKLDQFQAKFVELEVTRQRLENSVAEKVEPSLLKRLKLK